jgi:6-phosphogluconolactonase
MSVDLASAADRAYRFGWTGISQGARSMAGSAKVNLYASVGPELTHYQVDADAAALTKRGTVILPANVHYAWPHASQQYLYVATSDSASGIGGFVGSRHHVTAWYIDPASGALMPNGEPIPLPTRPIHMTSDIPSENLLVAFSNPSGLRVYRVNSDMTPGAEVVQPGPIDAGIYGHQVRVGLDNRIAILITRGHDAAAGKAEEPGALKVFRYSNGLLTGEVSVAPGGGYGFGPRHLDFHPSKPWIYVSLERQNRLEMFARDGDALSAAPLFRVGTLAEPGNIRGRQVAGTVHVHPNGRFVYVANRASSTVERDGRQVFAGGENTLAVFAIDPDSGEPARCSMSTRTASIAGRSTSIPAAGCSSPPTSWGCRSRTGRRSARCWRASPCFASPPTASSTFCANTMSRSATGRCSGWVWCSTAGYPQDLRNEPHASPAAHHDFGNRL